MEMSLSLDAAQAQIGERYQEARKIIEREYASPLTTQRLARRVRLPRLAFYVGFREAFGLAPEDYLRRWRLQQAAQLLAQGRSEHDTALLVGYTRHRPFKLDYRREFRGDAARLQLVDREDW